MGCLLSCCFGQKVAPNNDGGDEYDSAAGDAVHADEAFQKKRNCTDGCCLLTMAIFTLIMSGLIIYCMSLGDIYRIINGYDDCGNVCGRQNVGDPKLGCKGSDLRHDKFLITESGSTAGQVHRECVRSCDERSGYKVFLNRCIPEKDNEKAVKFFSKTGLANFYQELSEDLQMCAKEILYTVLAALAFSAIILILFRFVIGFVIGLVLIGVVICSIGGTIALWWQFSLKRKRNDIDSDNFMWYSIVATCVTVIVCLIILILRKRIKLVAQLFREAGKAIGKMPILLVEPFLTVAFLCITFILWIYFTIWIESSGILTIERNQSAKYEKDPIMLVTRWYILFGFFWFSQFVVGCQQMVIAGAVTSWFFTRNKSHLNLPVVKSFGKLIKYHLGTVAFGSFCIALVKFIRFIMAAVQYTVKNPTNRLTQCLFDSCQCCLSCFEKFLQYLTRNAYIETAIYSIPFCKAGKKAFGALANNALSVLAINSVGDFVLFLGKMLVCIGTMLVAIQLIEQRQGVHYPWILTCILGVFAFIVSHCFLTVYEMTIDTIFICFCEDYAQNDGINRPYYMSRGLMDFVHNTKKSLNIIDNRRNASPKQFDK